jgi:hypothetical protein
MTQCNVVFKNRTYCQFPDVVGFTKGSELTVTGEGYKISVLETVQISH